MTEPLQVWIDQDLCTGDGLCVQYAPEVFEFDVDGLAYVKDGAASCWPSAGAQTDVPDRLRLDVIDSAKECPGDCIHVVRARRRRRRSPAPTPDRPAVGANVARSGGAAAAAR